jgi:two-component system, cell cycle response regulator CtrA
MRALITSNDFYAATSIKLILEKEKVTCDTIDLGDDGLQMATLYDHDIILINLMMPDVNGYRMLQRLRAAGVRAPILILSGPSELDQRVKFLRSGADDFLIKPVEGSELVARIQAIVRRSRGHSESTIRTGKVVLNLDSRTVSVGDEPVHLTNKEYAILELLSLRRGLTVTRETLLDQLYGGMDEPRLKTFDVFICKLRKKLARATGGSHYIEAVWGQGYVLRDRTPPSATVIPKVSTDDAALPRHTVTEVGQAASVH